MAKKYVFVNNLEEKTPIYEMSEEELQRIQEANEKVYEIYRVEELFSMLIDNFYAFNNVIITYADRARLQSVLSEDYFQKRIAVNRAALNFFATLSIYLDYVYERIDGKETDADFSQNRNIQRCMVMRNYIQHVESFPVISNTSYAKCDVDVTLSSVRFLVDSKSLKTDKLHKGTQERFLNSFDAGEQIDLYEIINCGMAEVITKQKQIRKLPLYEEYIKCKMFLLDMEEKISTGGISVYHPSFYFESGDWQHFKTCFLAMDTIKFIDKNISNYGCTSSFADNFITTAPPDFVKKCTDEIFVPAIMQEKFRQKGEIRKG